MRDEFTVPYLLENCYPPYPPTLLLPMTTKKLPASVQEIADVLGTERALFLIGQLPRCYVRDGSERVILYVPKSLKPDNHLVTILGWHDAQRMVTHFGGELLAPANCKDVYRPFRDAGMRMMQRDGVPVAMIADWFGMTERRVRQVFEIPQEAPLVAANDNAPTPTARRAAPNGRKINHD